MIVLGFKMCLLTQKLTKIVIRVQRILIGNRTVGRHCLTARNTNNVPSSLNIFVKRSVTVHNMVFKLIWIKRRIIKHFEYEFCKAIKNLVWWKKWLENMFLLFSLTSNNTTEKQKQPSCSPQSTLSVALGYF